MQTAVLAKYPTRIPKSAGLFRAFWFLAFGRAAPDLSGRDEKPKPEGPKLCLGLRMGVSLQFTPVFAYGSIDVEADREFVNVFHGFFQ